MKYVFQENISDVRILEYPHGYFISEEEGNSIPYTFKETQSHSYIQLDIGDSFLCLNKGEIPNFIDFLQSVHDQLKGTDH